MTAGLSGGISAKYLTRELGTLYGLLDPSVDEEEGEEDSQNSHSNTDQNGDPGRNVIQVQHWKSQYFFNQGQPLEPLLVTMKALKAAQKKKIMGRKVRPL